MGSRENEDKLGHDDTLLEIVPQIGRSMWRCKRKERTLNLIWVKSCPQYTHCGCSVERS